MVLQAASNTLLAVPSLPSLFQTQKPILIKINPYSDLLNLSWESIVGIAFGCIGAFVLLHWFIMSVWPPPTPYECADDDNSLLVHL
jgi:hypothetical protein